MQADPNEAIGAGAVSGHLTIVQLLLERCVVRFACHGFFCAEVRFGRSKADPNEGLSCASRGGHASIAKLLLDKGADPHEGIEGNDVAWTLR
jgi:hypothetical protein